MENNNTETKLCRHCRSEIDKKAKVCPNCKKSQKRGKGCIIGLIIVAVLILIPVMLLKSCSDAVNDAIDEENKKAEAKSVSADEVIYNENDLKITYKGIESGSLNISTNLKLAFENKSDKSYTVTAEDFSVDGYSVDATFYIDNIAGGTSVNDTIDILDSYLEDNGLSADSIKQAKMKFKFTNSKDFMDSFETDTITVERQNG